MKEDDPRLDLLWQYVEGTASADTIAELEQTLKEDEAFRAFFLEYLNLDLALSLDANRFTPEIVSSLSASVAKPLAWLHPGLGAAAAIALLLGVAVWNANLPAKAVTVTRSVGIEELAPGVALGKESHTLVRGLLEMETTLGVRLVIEAPAEFRFESAQRLHLIRGRVAAEVPETGKGFTVLTPTGKAVDLGTRFGVDVPVDGEAEIHVFQGEVVAESTGGKPRSLIGGEGYSLQSGSGSTRELRSGAFIRPDEVASLDAAFSGGQGTRSQARLASLREDPELIALMDFEDPEALPQGVYRMVQGRWPGSWAPEFVEVRDHMKIDVGGDQEWPRVTLAAWVRLDRLGAPYQSLLHTDGWSESNTGQVHWMVTKLNTMRLALFGNTLAPESDEQHHYPDSRRSVLPEQGRWVHLATVYDADKGTVRFYLNGDFDKETRQEAAHPARFGPAQIGNWNRQDRKLSGRIDELLLLGRAMNDEEVRTLYEEGNPYR